MACTRGRCGDARRAASLRVAMAGEAATVRGISELARTLASPTHSCSAYAQPQPSSEVLSWKPRVLSLKPSALSPQPSALSLQQDSALSPQPSTPPPGRGTSRVLIWQVGAAARASGRDAQRHARRPGFRRLAGWARPLLAGAGAGGWVRGWWLGLGLVVGAWAGVRIGAPTSTPNPHPNPNPNPNPNPTAHPRPNLSRPTRSPSATRLAGSSSGTSTRRITSSASACRSR